MFLRLNQYAFAIFIFTLQATFAATLSYAFVLFVFLLGWQKNKIDPAMIMGSSAYVFIVSMASLLLAFILSIFLKKSLRHLDERKESYVVLTLAAIPAVSISIPLVGSAVSALNLVIYVATFLSIYSGAFFYRLTWQTLERLKVKSSQNA